MRPRSRVLALAFVGAALTACSGVSPGEISDDTTGASSSGGNDAGGGGSSSHDAGRGGGGGGTTDATTDATTGDGGSGGYSGASETGEITYYDATGAGACSFDATPDDLDVAAMDDAEYDNAAVCGECVSITGPKGQLTVRVVDRCPGCEVGHLDLSQEAFAKLADVSLGHVPVTWNVVECDVTGNLEYRYKDGVSQYWFALQVENSKLPLESLEIQQNGAWVNVERQSYNYFVDSKRQWHRPGHRAGHQHRRAAADRHRPGRRGEREQYRRRPVPVNVRAW